MEFDHTVMIPPAAAQSGNYTVIRTVAPSSTSTASSQARSTVSSAETTPKGKPLGADQAAAELTSAARRNSHSYRKASDQDGSADGTITPFTVTTTMPDQAMLNECLSRPNAFTKSGETLNRKFWCSQGYYVVEYGTEVNGNFVLDGVAMVNVINVAVGSENDRTWRVWTHAIPGTVKMNPAPTSMHPDWPTKVWGYNFLLQAECAQAVPYCGSTGGAIGTWTDWNVNDRWTYQDLSSPKTSGTGPDSVTYHSWYFYLKSEGGPYPIREYSSSQHMVRCDSATYLTYLGKRYPEGCVMYSVLPHLQYDLGNAKHAQVAKHIQDAQNNPNSTYPKESHSKIIPGKYTGSSTNGLHRISNTDARYAQNNTSRLAACNGTSPYSASTGMSPKTTAGQQCDEYPFRSTEEGASNPNFDFSVRAVASSHNTSAGASLGNFYGQDRILYNADQFWVEINGACATSCTPTASAAPVNLDPSGAGRLNGSFIQPALVDTWSNATLNAELAAMKAKHMSHVVLQWTANSYDKGLGGQRSAVFPTSQSGYVRSTNTDVVARLLAAANATGMEVYIGLQVSDQWWNVYANDANWINNEVATATALARELAGKYRSNASFKGWYLSFEIDNVHFGTQTAEDNVSNLLGSITNELRSIDNTLPIAISPFYNAVDTVLYGWQSPSTWASMWGRLLQRFNIDIIALQDGVGAGHASAATVGEWFSAMRDAMNFAGSPAMLFSDVETFIVGPSSLQPMTIRTIVADMNAVKPYVEGFWSFAYNHYQSPRSEFASTSYDKAYDRWAVNATGDGSDGDTPTAPTGLSATVNNSQQVTLTWTGSKDTNSGIAGYHIYRDNEWVADKLGTTASFVDRQLDGSRTYSYQIKAFDGSGNESAISATKTATTPATPVTNTNFARCGAATDAVGCAYTTDVAADALYPDTGGTKLTNGAHGLNNAYGPEWQGRNGVANYSFTIDLGGVRAVKEINSTWFQVRSDYTFLPPNVTYLVSTDGVNFTQASSIDIPAIGPGVQTKTYRAISLNVSARYVKVKVKGGDAWSMTDEVEVRG
ncbi:DUF4434 domain-containing protein [Dactylosporangium siamense]|uniref:DUF4434 domain-containing protein n=1 Tax=Dactylosporangium siamense TaxID=685454 RepID=UPI001945678E|nr:DUF4434 domain-containing protein [Dactylosporangium siamense]